MKNYTVFFSIFYFVGSKVLHFIEETGKIFSFFLVSNSWILKSKLDFKNLFKQMYQIGVLSLPVVLITGVFTGMVLAVQSYYQLRQFTVETSVATIIGLSMARELGPVLTGLMLAGRIGASMTAELGTMKVTEQIDALESLAANPIKFLVVPRLITCALLTPLLCVYSIFIGIVGGYVVSVKMLGIPAVFFIDNLKSNIQSQDMLCGIVKALFFGIVIATIGCYKGFNSKGGAEGVGKATTESVVLSCIIILISDFFLSILLF